jgi:oligogalacturonide lyase
LAIGDIYKNKFVETKDPFSGEKLIRLTSPEFLSHHMYFYYRMITGDGKFLIYASNIDGDRNIYRMDLITGNSTQLTEGKYTSDFDAILTSDDKYLIYHIGNEFRKMDLATLKSEVFYITPSGWQSGNPGISSDNKYLVVNEIEEKDIVKNTGGWSFFLPQWEAKPHCRIVYIDIDNLTNHIVLDEPECWLGHAQIRPFRNDHIMFCHEGPPGYIDSRIWMINSDGTNYRCVMEHPKDITMGHEFFFNDGSKISAVYRETLGEKKQKMYLIDADTFEKELFLETPHFGHFITNDTCDQIIADCQSEIIWEKTKLVKNIEDIRNIQNLSDPEELKMDALYIIDLKKKIIKYLCHHGSSATAIHGNTQDVHPHPVFSPDGKFIIFSSDRDGKPCVYRIDLRQDGGV